MARDCKATPQQVGKFLQSQTKGKGKGNGYPQQAQWPGHAQYGKSKGKGYKGMYNMSWDTNIQWPMTQLGSLAEAPPSFGPAVVGGITSFFSLDVPDEARADQWKEVQAKNRRGHVKKQQCTGSDENDDDDDMPMRRDPSKDDEDDNDEEEENEEESDDDLDELLMNEFPKLVEKYQHQNAKTPQENEEQKKVKRVMGGRKAWRKLSGSEAQDLIVFTPTPPVAKTVAKQNSTVSLSCKTR